MKKASFSFCILFLIAMVASFGLTSCKSTDTEQRYLSSSDCLYTLSYVLNLATDKAVPALFSDLNNYKDYSHYSKDISHYIYECMRDGKCELTVDNSFDTLLKFSEDIADYDHEQSFH